jgi:hypothetical protein
VCVCERERAIALVEGRPSSSVQREGVRASGRERERERERAMALVEGRPSSWHTSAYVSIRQHTPA